MPDASSWKALGIEVGMRGAFGELEFVIVPEYTRKNRFELSADHLEKILHVCEFFGVEKVSAFRRLGGTKEAK